MHTSVFLKALFSSNTHFFLYLVATYTNFKQKQQFWDKLYILKQNLKRNMFFLRIRVLCLRLSV